MPANLENSAVATGLEKANFHTNPKERQCQRVLKLPHNSLISHTSKEILKILQARFQQYVNCELPDVQAGFRKSRDIHLPMKLHLVKSMVFPVVMYGCESWTVKRAEQQRIDAFELDVGEDS